ncbi:MAG: DUF58 domain-containing protein [Planctomycetota bacterium]|jgi:uncharacterized protein (DUF58 family)
MTRFRITLRGVVHAVLAAAIGTAAALKGNNLLFLVFAALVAVFLTSAVLTWWMTRRVAVSRTVPDAASAEESFTYEIRVRNGARLRPLCFLRIRDRLSNEGRASPLPPTPVLLPLVGPGREVRAAASAVALQRGRARLGPVQVTAEFPPGFFSCTRTLRVRDRLLVYPRRARLRRQVVNPYLSQMEYFDMTPVLHSAGTEEFAGLREFRPGDNPRWIHWKMSARVPGRLLVREYEDTRVRNAVILLETFLPNPADVRRRFRLERAVSFAAALAELLLAENYIVSFRAYAPSPVHLRLEPRRGATEELLYLLALLKPTRVHPLADLLARETGEQDEIYFLLQISPGEPPAWPFRSRTVNVTAPDMKAMMVLESSREGP